MEVTMNQPTAPSATPAAPAWRARLRFSLATLVWASLAVGATLLLVLTHRENLALRGENRKLHGQLGHLVVTDPSRIHVVAGIGVKGDFWRWRIYIPAGKGIRLHTQTSEVPHDGFGIPDVVDGGLSNWLLQQQERPREFEVQLQLLKNNYGHWSYAYRFNGEVCPAAPPFDEDGWLQDPKGELYKVFSRQAGTERTVTAESGKPFELLRVRSIPYRQMEERFLGRVPGILVWIQEEMAEGESLAAAGPTRGANSK
jgi:hypothetical protein